MASDILNEMGWRILETVLPILATSLTAWVLTLVASAWRELQSKRPDLVGIIKEASDWVIPVVEQLKNSGKIASNTEAKEYAVFAIEEYIKAMGLKVDPNKYRFVISQSIEGALKSWKEWHPQTDSDTVGK